MQSAFQSNVVEGQLPSDGEFVAARIGFPVSLRDSDLRLNGPSRPRCLVFASRFVGTFLYLMVAACKGSNGKDQN
jgi:hypothetical protein